MNTVLVPTALGLLGFCIAAEAVQQLSFKIAADKAGRARSFVGHILRQPLVWVGVAIWMVESVVWVLVLQTTPLTQAYPVMTLSYATVPLAGVLVLKERMSRRQVAGAALILAGVACVAASGLST
jgi:drug/metabolite transporter (DMT)-like permease